MGISLAPDDGLAPDPITKKRPVSAPNPNAGMPGYDLVGERQIGDPIDARGAAGPIGLAPASGAPPMTAPAPMTAPGIPAPTVAAPPQPVDRVKLATDVFNQSAASTQGAYDAASKDNIHNSAALGQIGSGGLRTREGNLQLARGRDLDLLRAKLVNDATTGSIADASTAYQQALASSQQGLASELGKGGLALEKEKAATNAGQSQQQIDLAKKQQEINTAFESGRLTLAQKNQALAELQNTQQFGLEGQKLELAKDSLAQAGAQFGLSLAQQKELQTLADKTANRQLDISSAQGQNALLLELARIMGSKDMNVDPNFIAAVAKALGLSLPNATQTGGAGAGPGAGSGGALAWTPEGGEVPNSYTPGQG